MTDGKGKGRRGKRLSVTEAEVMAAMSGGEDRFLARFR